ncbi:hypothetical protein C8J56DRAFT_1175417 [Mycena floridula]|nr:hypothetical protein C8J56DRAFT_1175417 [Mycena floridula]
MVSQSSQIYYIVDDTTKEVEHDIADSETSIDLFNRTSTYLSSLQMNFDGTSVLFVGELMQPGSLVTIIDDNSPSSLSFHSVLYGQLYQSPTVDDTAKIHTINATVAGPTLLLDYIAVSPGKETALLGRTLMVDDMYSGLSFGSGWVTTDSEPAFNLASGTPGFPFQNTTHRASTPGSVFSFSYTGSSLLLYGVFDWDQRGSYELTSTIDDELPVSKTFDARNSANLGFLQPNFVLFSRELEAGNHTATFTPVQMCQSNTYC